MNEIPSNALWGFVISAATALVGVLVSRLSPQFANEQARLRRDAEATLWRNTSETIAQLRADLDEERARGDQRDAEIAAERARGAQRDTEIATLRGEHDNLKAEHALVLERAVAAETERDEARADADRQRARANAAEAERDELVAKIMRLETKVARLEEHVRQLEPKRPTRQRPATKAARATAVTDAATEPPPDATDAAANDPPDEAIA